jgi:hypothetical protein
MIVRRIAVGFRLRNLIRGMHVAPGGLSPRKAGSTIAFASCGISAKRFAALG